MSAPLPRHLRPFPVREKWGQAQLLMIVVGLPIVGATAVAVASYAGAAPFKGLGFWIPFGVTSETAILYVLRYYAISVYYGQEETGPALILSVVIVCWGILTFATVLLGFPWLAAYAVLLILSVLKEKATIRLLDKELVEQRQLFTGESSASSGIKPEQLAELIGERQAALQHERDLMWVEGGLSAFLFGALLFCYLRGLIEIGLAGAEVLFITAGASVLFYVTTFVLLKVERFAPLIDLAARDA